MYNACGAVEPTTGELIEDLARVAALARDAVAPLTGRRIAELLFHEHPIACKKDDTAFKQWGRKGKWKEAAKATAAAEIGTEFMCGFIAPSHDLK